MKERKNISVKNLTLEDRRDLIFAFFRYKVEIHGADEEDFGPDFKEIVESAYRTGDKRGVLQHGSRDVVSSLALVRGQPEQKAVYGFFSQYLGEARFRLMLQKLGLD